MTIAATTSGLKPIALPQGAAGENAVHVLVQRQLTAAHCFQAYDQFGIDEFWVTLSNRVDASATLLTGTSHVALGRTPEA